MVKAMARSSFGQIPWAMLLLSVSLVLSGSPLLATETPEKTETAATTASADLPKLQLVRELPAPGDTFSVLWSSDGSKLAAYSYSPGPNLLGTQLANPFGNRVTIWTADGQVYRELSRATPFFGFFDTFAFAADNREIVTPPLLKANDLAFSVFDIASGDLVREVDGNYPKLGRNVNGAKLIVASPDQTIIAATFGRALPQPVTLYSTRDWSKLAVLPEGPRNMAERPDALAFSPDGKFLAVARGAGEILLYDVNSKSVVIKFDAFPDIGGPVHAIAFSPDGELIAVGTATVPGTVHSIRTGETREIVIRDPVRVFHTKDGSRAAVNSGSTDRIHAVTWSPIAGYLAFITEHPKHPKLHLWDPLNPNDGERTIELNAGAESLAFSPDGRYLAVGNGRVVSIFIPAP